MMSAELYSLGQRELEVIRKVTPYRTGNLSLNATKCRSLGDRRIELLVDQKIAPYFCYVNGRERLGKREIKNKNFGYWRRACDAVIEDIASALGGRVER